MSREIDMGQSSTTNPIRSKVTIPSPSDGDFVRMVYQSRGRLRYVDGWVRDSGSTLDAVGGSRYHRYSDNTVIETAPTGRLVGEFEYWTVVPDADADDYGSPPSL